MPRAKRRAPAPAPLSEAQLMVLGLAAPLIAMNDLPPARFGGYRVGEPSATHQLSGLSMLPRAEGQQRITLAPRTPRPTPCWRPARCA